MKKTEKYNTLFVLLIPLTAALLVIAVTAGYFVCRFAKERAYRQKWKDYNDCGFA